MKRILTNIFPLVMLLIVGCTNDSESDLISIENEEIVNPETPVTYAADIQAIISNRCLGCHSDPPAGAPFPLATYDQVSARALNGQILGAISRSAGDPRIMPPSGRLPQSTIDLIEKWIQDGAIEE
ncbi:hypothetical protein ACFQ1M_05050 [Sungkyunkwania multivorans]|uniref:Cytochrome c domain-containing protein n=1 Tax=Sungkyunkwania multivorans TaxID=1173618 RepID=A0ABW3CV91_9FLAO